MKIDAPDVEYPAEVYWSQEDKLASLDPDLRARLERVMDHLRAEGYRPHLVYGWRSHGAQARLVAAGKSWTHFSRHNVTGPDGRPKSRAADLIDKRPEYQWTGPRAGEFFARLCAHAEAEGLTCGARWDPGDPSHVELDP